MQKRDISKYLCIAISSFITVSIFMSTDASKGIAVIIGIFFGVIIGYLIWILMGALGAFAENPYKHMNNFKKTMTGEAEIERIRKEREKQEEIAKKKYERQLKKCKECGREKDFLELHRNYQKAAYRYATLCITGMGQMDYISSLKSSKKDPYISGGIINGLTGSSALGAATVIQNEMRNQEINQKVIKESAELKENKSAFEVSKMQYYSAINELNELLSECGAELESKHVLSL